MKEHNFTLIGKGKQIDYWKLQLSIYWYFKSLSTLKLNYSITPLFATFKSGWCKYIGHYYRLYCTVIPLIPVLLLVQHYTNAIWWWILIVGFGIWLGYSVICLLYDIACKIRVKAHNESISSGKAVITRYGTPGAGKTSSLLYDMKILADVMWEIIEQEYKLLEPHLADIPYWPKKQREDAEEIIESYNFNKKSGCYPCLWTSVPAFVDGVPCFRLTADHLMQRERMPYGAVVILDEISLILPQELFRDKPYEIVEMAKFPRHFGDFHIGTTEQGKDSVLVYMRRVTAENKCMVKQQWVLQPKLLQWIYDKLLEHTKHMTKFKANFFRIFQKLINHIGYRKYYYFDSGNENEQVKTKTKTFILPPYLNVTYDSRAFKNAYRCKDKALKQSSWEHLRLSKTEIDEIFTEELKQRAKSKQQKNNIKEKAG